MLKSEILKKIVAALLGAIVGSGITIKINEQLSVNCKPVVGKYETARSIKT